MTQRKFTWGIKRLTLGALGAGLLAASAGGASAQSCNKALGPYALAMKADTAAALQGYLDQHAPCFAERATARLEELRAAAPPAPAPAPTPAPAPAPAPAPTVVAGPVKLIYLAPPKFADPFIDSPFLEKTLSAIDNVSTARSTAFLPVAEQAEALRRNRVQIGTVLIGSMPLEFPGHALDLPLVTSDPAKARAMVDALRPAVTKAMLADGLALLAAAPAAMPVVLTCGTRVTQWEHLVGNDVAAEGYIVPALRDYANVKPLAGIIDSWLDGCYATGSTLPLSLRRHTGNNFLTPAPLLGWGVVSLVASAEAWNVMPPARQAALLQAARTEYEDPYWNGLEARFKARLACMSGNSPCPRGITRGQLPLLAQLPEDGRARALLREGVLPAWEKHGPPELVQAWKAAAREVLGLDLR